ncbi:hypothetical protein BC830DRAFT_1166570 [Chytriomyces sp. MP71]|nr:hypothetical protein BC830DRAFT_1166570 [Chytriomyces sp. MP71]
MHTVATLALAASAAATDPSHHRCDCAAIVDSILRTDAAEATAATAASAAPPDASEPARIRYTKHEFGYNLEGDWDAIVALAKKCREEVLRAGGGSQRVRISLAMGTRLDKKSTLEDKLKAVHEKNLMAG